MRHSYFGKKLSRTKNERRRLFQILLRNLLTRGSLRTTWTKAKVVQPLMEKLITKAKRGGRSDIKVVKRTLTDKLAVQKLLAQATTRFASRASGFTRIVKLGARAGDGSEEAILSFVDEPVVASPQTTKAKSVGKEKETKQTKPGRTKSRQGPDKRSSPKREEK